MNAKYCFLFYCVAAASCLMTLSAMSMAFGDTSMISPVNIGDRRELFVDHLLIDHMSGVSLRLHEPISGGVAISCDKPWEGPANFGYVVIPLDNRLLMYYRAMTLDENVYTGVLCVAVSDDGETWTKPSLGLVERDGQRDNNITGDESGTSLMLMPFLDTRPGVPHHERVKAFMSEPLRDEKDTAAINPKGPKRLVMWGSADGFTFRKLDPQPDIVSHLPNCFDHGNTMFWSEAEQAYVLYYRTCEYEGRGRTVARITSKDFMSWTEPVSMTYGDTPPEQFYTNNTTPYFRAPHIYCALAPRFMERRRVLTDEQAALAGIKKFEGYIYYDDCSDAVLLTSRAGSTVYDRTFLEALVRPGIGYQHWGSRTNYPLTGLMPLGKDHMMFWVTRRYMQDAWNIERMILRVDGFASLNAPHKGGECVTKPLLFCGGELEINYSTSAAGSIRIALQDEANNPIPGFTVEDCPEIIGDETSRVVAWKNGPDVASLAGKPVRLRMVMKDADLYSFRFR